MKRNILLFLTCVFYTSSFAQITETDKYASLCRVWGFLKYYHPQAAKRSADWDRELMSRVSSVAAANDREQLSKIYLQWIGSLKKVPVLKTPRNNVADTTDKNYENEWMDNDRVFTDSLKTLLHYIEDNKKKKVRSHYIRRHFPQMNQSFRNEKRYRDSVMPSLNMRLLCMARYWNIVQYYYPYKYMTDTPWQRVLENVIPVFVAANDTPQYYWAMATLIANINDSHGYLSMRKDLRIGGINKAIPAGYSITHDDTVVINEIYNDSLAAREDVKPGEVILKVNGRLVKEIIDEKLKHVCASNRDAAYLRLSWYNSLTYGNKDSIVVLTARDGVIKEKTVKRYAPQLMKVTYGEKKGKQYYRCIDDSIGYLDLDVLRIRHVRRAMKKAANTKTLIVDVRNYPKMTMFRLARFLNGHRTKFATFVFPQWSYPGHFRRKGTNKIGWNHHSTYNGKVILLFNARTQSHGEFTCMGLQQGRDVTCIGSQTAGADGDVAAIHLPGGYDTRITGLGVYYPDGTPTQRIGIVPDITVYPTAAGIAAQRDEVLERALQYIRTGK